MRKEFIELWKKYKLGELSKIEQEQFDRILQRLNDSELSEIIDDTIEIDMGAPFKKNEVFSKIEAEIDSSLKPVCIKRKIDRIIPYLSAAVLLVFFTLTLTIFFQRNTETGAEVKSFAKVSEKDVLLSTDKQAKLIMGDGSSYAISKNIENINDKNVQVTPLQNGFYRFEFSGDPKEKEVYHAFETPIGISYPIILSDGTKVWLSSASKLEVSSKFSIANERMVRISGEAFFEVAHDASRPFLINTKGSTISVLGTAFNVRSRLNDNNVETTLVHGLVKVKNVSGSVVLNPGQQAVSDLGGGIVKRVVDVEQVCSWKSGYFEFVDKPIAEILNELAEWYVVEGIEWKRKSKDHLTLSLARSRSLDELLKKIELTTDLHLSIKERRIVVE